MPLSADTNEAVVPNSHHWSTPTPEAVSNVPLHGAEVLTQPKVGFCVMGMKSYGRAPSFLLQTGYEQVRSVAAAVAATLAGEGVQDTVDALAGAGR